MSLVQKDHLKKKFNDALGIGIKSEDTAVMAANHSAQSVSYNSSILRERQKENEILASTSILNAKINQLNALASIHAAYVQREVAAGLRATEQQLNRTQLMETQMERLNNEIEQLNGKMEEELGTYKTNTELLAFQTPQAVVPVATVGVVTGSVEQNSEDSIDLLESPQEDVPG